MRVCTYVFMHVCTCVCIYVPVYTTTKKSVWAVWKGALTQCKVPLFSYSFSSLEIRWSLVIALDNRLSHRSCSHF